jgi:hypothetical protein
MANRIVQRALPSTGPETSHLLLSLTSYRSDLYHRSEIHKEDNRQINMHWTATLLFSLSAIVMVRAGSCLNAADTSTGVGFAAFMDVAASWEEGSMPAEIKVSRSIKTS